MNDSELDLLAARVGAALAARGWMMAAAESCTGGWIAQAVTAIAGSSAWFERGFVTYSNAAKESLLGVPAAILERHGAVSEEVAAAMAGGALANSRAQIAVSVTGVAGPGGGTPAKPVGMVCFGWTAGAGPAITDTRYFSGERVAIRRQAVIHALARMLALLQDSR